MGKTAWERLLSLKEAYDPGIEPRSPISQADSLLSEPPGKPLPTTLWVKFFFFYFKTYFKYFFYFKT